MRTSATRSAGAGRLDVTVLKADISGSTSLGERLDPEELRGVIGAYFAALAREIQRHGGFVDKYIGDAVLAGFPDTPGSEPGAVRALRAALAMQAAIAAENETLQRRYGVRLSLRIGASTGPAAALPAEEGGSGVGLLGEVVTAAEALEALARTDTVLASERTFRSAREAFEFAPTTQVRGASSRGRIVVRALRAAGAESSGSVRHAAGAAGSSASLQVRERRADVLQEERKIVTVLFADVVRTAVPGQVPQAQDERGLLGAYFGTLAREIQRFGGTIDKFVGDAVMAVFGAPISHDDDAARAIRAAVAIREAMRRQSDELRARFGVALRARIGINTGEVVAGMLAGEVQAYTVTGDAVNTAQRIESVAPLDEILVSGSTYALARGAFACEPVAPLTLKGKSSPIAAYRVIGRASEAVVAGTPLLGRAAELARLETAYRAAAGGRGRLVHVHGEAGIGKTRLVSEFLTGLPAGATRLRARCSSYEAETPYALVADLVRAAFGLDDGADESIAAGKLRHGLAQLVGPALESAIALLLEILGYGERSPLDPEGKRRLLVSTLRALFRARSAPGPLVVLLEDLHWIDSASAALLGELAGPVRELPCLLVSTSREASVVWEAEAMPLQPLDVTSAADMVDRVAGQPLAAEVRALVLQRTEGNPFFIEEVVRALAELSTTTVPATVQEVLEARLDALDPAPRLVAQRAAVVGRTFSARILQRLAPREALEDALQVLERVRFIREDQQAAEPTYTFHHALVQEVAYKTQLISQRRRLHAGVGDAIAAEYPDRVDEFVDALAYHYRRGDDDSKARTWLLRAGQRAQHLYAKDEGLDYFRGALERAADHPETRAVAHEGIADVLRVTGLYPDAIESYRAALDVADGVDPVRRCRLLRKTGAIHHLQGQPERALEIFDGVLRELPEQATDERARTLQQIGEIRWRQGRYGEAVERLLEAVAESGRAGDDDARAETLKQLGTVYMHLGDFERSERFQRSALELYEALGDAVGQANAQHNLGFLARRRSRHREAIEWYERSLAIRERVGDQLGMVRSHNNLGEVCYLRGDLGRAEEHFAASLATARAIGFAPGVANALIGLGATKVERDDADAGRAHLFEGVRLFERLDNKPYLVEALRDLIQAHLDVDPALAVGSAERAVAIAEEIGSPERLGIALQALGVAREAGGDLRGAIEALERSRAVFESGAERQELARTVGALGRCYRRLPSDDPRRGEAEALIGRARGILTELGATLDLRRLEEALGPT